MPLAPGRQDGKHPAAESLGAAQAAEAAEGLERRFLHGVLRFLPASEGVQRIPVQIRIQLFIQFAKCAGIPLAASRIRRMLSSVMSHTLPPCMEIVS